eukprot:6955728-Prymnesium_polylepis.1
MSGSHAGHRHGELWAHEHIKTHTAQPAWPHTHRCAHDGDGSAGRGRLACTAVRRRRGPSDGRLG